MVGRRGKKKETFKKNNRDVQFEKIRSDCKNSSASLGGPQQSKEIRTGPKVYTQHRGAGTQAVYSD